MKLDVPTLARLSPLMDEALELDNEQLVAWLSNISPDNADLVPVLQELLSRKTSIQTSDILQRGPEFTAPGTANHLSDFKANDTVGQYRLLRELGRGGMGEVWLAERTDGSIRRQIALKLPHIALPQRQLVERFARERDILASLVHVNIARLYDAGVSDKGQPYLALEYVQGEMLTTWCDAKKLGINARIELFRQVFAAVEYAHRQLVVHRDLKPSNILVTADGQVRLLDFGIAKLMTEGQAHETELTQLGGRVLSLQYASPEQVLGRPIATTSDVYSLAVVLHELLTGSLPYQLDHSSNVALENAVLNTEAIRASKSTISVAQALSRGDNLRHLRLVLKGDIETILQKALKKHPGDRYGSAEAFADDLEHFLAGEAVLAQPDSRWYRSAKFLRRNWLASSAAATVLVSLTAGLGIALWQAQAARQEAQTARAVQDFLLDIFQANSSNQFDPQKARGTTARELLDIGARKIERSLNTAPEAKLVLLDTLGQMYRDLGIDKEAADMNRKRAALARSTYGNSSIELADALVDLADALTSSLDDPDMANSISEAGVILDLRGDNNSVLRARLLATSAVFYQERDLNKAVQLSEGALSILRKYPPSRLLVKSLSTAAQSYTLTGNWSKSQVLLDEAIAAALDPRGGSQADLLPTLLNGLGFVSANLGNPMEAESSLARSWQLNQARNGDEHVDTVMYLVDYANQLLADGRSAEAIAKLESAIEGSKHVKGADAAEVQINVLETYGDDLMFYGRLEDAFPVLTHARVSLAKTGGDSPRMATLLGIIAHLFTEMGRFEEAQSLLDKAHTMRVHANALDSSWAGAERMFSLRLLLAQDRVSEANTLVSLMTEPGPSKILLPSRFVENFYRECAALASKNAKMALELAQSDLRSIDSSPQREYYRVAEQKSRWIAGMALMVLGQNAQAETELRRSLALAENLFDPVRSPQLAEVQIGLAEALLNMKQVQEANVLAAKARAIHMTHMELGDQYRRPLRALEARLAGKPKR